LLDDELLLELDEPLELDEDPLELDEELPSDELELLLEGELDEELLLGRLLDEDELESSGLVGVPPPQAASPPAPSRAAPPESRIRKSLRSVPCSSSSLFTCGGLASSRTRPSTRRNLG
jgi:hypothetical protein